MVYLDDKADIDNTMANLARLERCMAVNTNVMYHMSVITPLRQSIIHRRSLFQSANTQMRNSGT